MNDSLQQKFAALGDATRFAIVDRLLSVGEQNAGELSDLADISAPAMSRHLKVLREAGLVERRIDGQHRVYSASPRAIGDIGRWTIAHRDFWSDSFDRLDAAMKEET